MPTELLPPPPSRFDDELAIRDWFDRVPTAIGLLALIEIDVYGTAAALRWFLGRTSFAEYSGRRRPFSRGSLLGRRRTARNDVKLVNAIAHVERGSRSGFVHEAARILFDSRQSCWTLYDVLDGYTEPPAEVVDFAWTVDGPEDRQVLWDLLHDHGWSPRTSAFQHALAAL